MSRRSGTTAARPSGSAAPTENVPAEASAAVNAAQDELGPDTTLDALVRVALKKAAKP